MAREVIHTSRDVEVLRVPSGERSVLPKGSWLVVQQSLGGQFTAMTDVGGLVRVDGKDADALGPEYVAEVEKALAGRTGTASGPFDEEQVWDALRQVYDPEIPASIVELGLVYLVAAEQVDGGGHKVVVRMTLTAPGCGIGPVLVEDVRRATLSVPGVVDADVEIVFDPPWDPSRMSDAAKLQLGFL
jgi:probable FeS assembly SUF system protein SufT